jgi:hypothetical protein
MNELLTLAILPGIVWAVLVFLRVPGVTLILSILVGKLFSEELSQNAYDLANKTFSISDMRQVQLCLLLLPVVLTLILTQSKTAKSKVVSNAVPLLFGAVTLILFTLPYTSFSDKVSSSGQDIINSYQSYIVCATGGIALLYAWSPDLFKSKLKGKHK